MMIRKPGNRLFQLVAVLLLSTALLILFYGKLLFSLNTTFFSADGDGIQSYFNATYLALHDSSLLYSHSMNYPYGEISFYTLSQPLLMGPVKWISTHVTDITGSIVGIINASMLFSIILAAVFLYLIFSAIDMPAMVSVPVATAIAFLSPQIDRMGGHYTLSYVWAIPFLIYFLLLFHKHRKSVYSLVIGAGLFILITGHIYFAAFFFAMLAIYWLSIIGKLKQPPLREYLAMLGQFTLQFILPVAAFYLITGFYEHLIPDRPSKPYGFLVYKASPESVFLPLGLEYGRFLHKLRNFGYVQWEGISYVGLTAAVGFFIILIRIIGQLVRRHWQASLNVTDNPFLNSLFWAAFITLLYSFGIPFIFGLDFLLDYLGPVQQMRALGRFAWPFFYVINIVVFYKLWLWQQHMPKRSVVFWLAIAMLFVDVFYYSKGRQNRLSNSFPEWADTANTLPDNQWVDYINTNQYQSVIPIPFYHMGSDNYSIHNRCNMLANSFLVSEKTGLPVMAIYISRASVSQSVKSIALGLEPYREPAILHDLPSRKPFVVVVANCSDLTHDESNLLTVCTKIGSTARFTLYALEYDSLLILYRKKSEQVFREMADNRFDKTDTVYLTNPENSTLQVSFNDKHTNKGYQDNARFIAGRSKSVLYRGPLPKGEHQHYSLSCWFYPADIDLFPKTRMEICWYDNQGKPYRCENIMLGHYLKTIDGSWGLVEYPFSAVHADDYVQITVYNKLITRKQSYLVDELWIRPDSCGVYYRNQNLVMKNNRWYPLPE